MLREDNPGRHPEVIVHGATFDDRTPGNKNVTPNELDCADEPRATKEEEKEGTEYRGMISVSS